MQDYYFVYDLELKYDNQFSPPRQYRSLGIGRKNYRDIIKQTHYNTTFPGYRADPFDVSYFIGPEPPKKDETWFQKHIVLIISISVLLILLIAVVACTLKRRSNKKGDRSISGKTNETLGYRDHLQTMTTGRGTDVEGMSNVYNSVLSDRDTETLKSIKSKK